MEDKDDDKDSKKKEEDDNKEKKKDDWIKEQKSLTSTKYDTWFSECLKVIFLTFSSN